MPKTSRLTIIAALLLSLNTLRGEETFFSRAEWQEISKKYPASQDFIALADGTTLLGTVERLPSIHFSFATLPFSPEEVAVVAVADQNIQYITQSGLNYTGPLAKRARFLIWLPQPSEKNPQHVVQKELSADQIHFIILKNHAFASSARFFTLALKNGQRLPVTPARALITLSDGMNEMKLDPTTIIELRFDGGIQGSIAAGEAIDSLGFAFVKDRFLSFHTPNIAALVKIPWDQISHLQTAQNGFAEDSSNTHSRLIGASIYLPTPAAESGSLQEPRSAGVHTSQPDSIGNSEGKALQEAAGFRVTEMPAKEENGALLEVTEEALYQDLPKANVDPPTFDLPSAPEESAVEPQESAPALPQEAKEATEQDTWMATVHPDLVDSLEKILEEGEADTFPTPPPSRAQAIWEELMAYDEGYDLDLLPEDEEEADRKESESDAHLDLLWSEEIDDEKSERDILDALLE